MLGERLAEDQQRDFIGYGRRPPHPRWPGDARLALNFVVNYEEGAEYSLLNGDDRPETILSEAGAAPPVLGSRDLNMESMYDYGARAGVWRVFRAFTEQSVTPTVYVVGLALEQAHLRLRPPDGLRSNAARSPRAGRSTPGRARARDR